MSATPRPWRIDRCLARLEDGKSTYPCVNGWRLSYFDYRHNPERAEADALLIWRAVNAHAALVEALKAAADYMGEQAYPEDVLEQARAALKVSGVEPKPKLAEGE